jgi:hypothetical protein
MRWTCLLAIGAAALAVNLGVPASASAGGTNRDGYGIYSPLEPPTRHRPRAYRYDPRSWYYREASRYYPFYQSGYWVPRPEMRYRYRYTYYGPRYQYYPAWGW